MQRIGANGTKKLIRTIIALVSLALLIAFDQLTKSYFSNLYKTEGLVNIEIIPNFLRLVYTENTGAAWSFLSDVSWAQTFFKVITGLSLVLFIGMYVYALKSKRLLRISLILIIAGTVGNFVDRLLFGYVVDFISFNFWGWSFPVFNVADICLTIGVVLFMIYLLFISKYALFRKNNAK